MMQVGLTDMPIVVGRTFGLKPNSMASLQQSANDLKTLLFKSDAEIVKYYQNYNADDVALREVETVYSYLDNREAIEKQEEEKKEREKAEKKAEKMKKKAEKAQSFFGGSDKQGTTQDDFLF